MAGIEKMHGSGVTAAADGPKTGKVLVDSWADINFKEGGRIKMEEVEVQTWKDGKISHIRFIKTLQACSKHWIYALF